VSQMTAPVVLTWGSNTSYGGFNVPPGESKQEHTPKGLLITRAVQVVGGWVGQVIVDKNVVWQSSPQEGEDERCENQALKAANDRVVNVLGNLFAE
jgi:hypothetical protein